MRLKSERSRKVSEIIPRCCKQSLTVNTGFSTIFSVQDLRIFPPEELGLLFGNAEEDWSREGKPHPISEDLTDLPLKLWSMPSKPITGTTSTAERCKTWSK